MNHPDSNKVHQNNGLMQHYLPIYLPALSISLCAFIPPESKHLIVFLKHPIKPI